jgi:hypothetical protein
VAMEAVEASNTGCCLSIILTPEINNLREEKFILAHSLRLQSMMLGLSTVGL